MGKPFLMESHEWGASSNIPWLGFSGGKGIEMLKNELEELSRIKSKRLVYALKLVWCWYERNEEALQIWGRRVTQ